MPPSKNELQAFLGKINFPSKCFSSMAEACGSLRQLTSVTAEWTWNATYQKLFDIVKLIIKEDTCMKYYD